MQKTVKEQIVSRIYGRGRGWAFTPNDFMQDFKRWEIGNSLEDLTKENRIRRLISGVYDYPLYSKLLKKNVAPDMQQVANAIARKFNWRIQPTGDTALTYLGLSNQVSGNYTYLSDGPNKQYAILEQVLNFKHMSFKEATITDKNAMLVVQAIKAIGEKNITEEFLQKLASKFSSKEWLRIKKHSSTAVIWIQNCINSIIEDLGA